MKKVILFAWLIFSFSGCIQRYLPHIEEEHLIDFRDFSKNGFLFSSSDYNGKYKSVGILTAEYFPEVTLLTKRERYGKSNIDTSRYFVKRSMKIEKVDFDDVFNFIYKKAKAMGADAVVNIRLTRKEHPVLRQKYTVFDVTDRPFCDGWIVQGMAIERNE